jgi:DNA recombination protein RmuC
LVNATVVILLTLAALLAGAALAWLAARGQQAGVAQRKAELEHELGSTKSQLLHLQAENSSLNATKSAVEATLLSERSATQEKLELLTRAREEMRGQFAALAASALQSNNASFLQLAKGELEKQQSEAKLELEKREKAVETMVKPIADSLKSVDEHVRTLESSRAEAYGGLKVLVESLQESQVALKAETGNLVKALREPQARGRWGELQLRRCLELAGMLDYCDFREQVTATADERMKRPDVIVKLPGEKNIVVDAKVPLVAYLAALEATDEASREAHLKDHARQVRQHIDLLGAKAYWHQFEPTPEFVVLFLPGEVFFRAAMDADPELIEYGVARKVIVASPTTLIALLRAVAYGWNQKNLADSAKKISEAGKVLYERLCKMSSHFEDMGKRLGGAVEAYNKAVGSMERSVFPAARKMPELDRSLAAEDLPDLKQVEKVPQQLEAPDWAMQPEPLSLLGEPGDETRKQ